MEPASNRPRLIYLSEIGSRVCQAAAELVVVPGDRRQPLHPAEEFVFVLVAWVLVVSLRLPKMKLRKARMLQKMQARSMPPAGVASWCHAAAVRRTSSASAILPVARWRTSQSADRDYS